MIEGENDCGEDSRGNPILINELVFFHGINQITTELGLEYSMKNILVDFLLTGRLS